MDWIEIAIKTTHEGADIAAQVFYETGVTGVVIEDPDDLYTAQQDGLFWDYVDESVLANKDEGVLVKAYINNDAAFNDKLIYIKERIEHLKAQDLDMDLGPMELSLTNVREEDWSNNWKKYYKPVRISDRLVIKPTWEDYEPKEGEYVLNLDPGMAFGTGTHETTVLCLRLLDRHVNTGDTIADIGCGTGILSIAALLLGADRATAIDLDTNAVMVARENARLNGVEDRMQVIHGNLLDKVQGRYDIITANIIADAIISLTQHIRNYLKPGGIFISSGIILERLPEVVEKIEESGLEVIHKETMGEWAAVVGRHNA
ncbi:MAG TPA: 50S ribosomal protein L11 methyltransferase [Candidatus Atribacteria bacterium]|nr:50S ribosomal protein L11 methyltransferase [Candidatus Atribacteria bacterium]HPT78868.1 50S ribosomal protein L11 methyltransferase [Candidatus Atribacteria bacterium]